MVHCVQNIKCQFESQWNVKTFSQNASVIMFSRLKTCKVCLSRNCVTLVIVLRISRHCPPEPCVLHRIFPVSQCAYFHKDKIRLLKLYCIRCCFRMITFHYCVKFFFRNTEFLKMSRCTQA